MENRYVRIINKMNKKRVLVIGDIMLDEYVWGNVERISPEAPVPIIDVKQESIQLGGAGNVVKNLTSLGAEVYLNAVVGADSAGEKISNILDYLGVKGSLVIDRTRRTSIKTRIMAHSQHVIRIDKEDKDCVAEEIRNKIIDIDDNIEFHGVILSDYGKGVIDTILVDRLRKYCNKKYIPLYVDPKERNFESYLNVDLITPNIKELSYGANMQVKTSEDVEKAAQIIFERLKCKHLLATRGEDGMSLFTNHTRYDIPSFAHNVYDVTGAGDTVISVFTLASISGAPLLDAAMIANAAAGIVVGEVGAVSIKKENLIEKCLNLMER